MATGSCEDLDKLEHECEAACKQLHREIDTECGHPKSRDLTHGHITGEMSMALHSSMADPLTQALPVSILTQRSNALREAGPTNIDA